MTFDSTWNAAFDAQLRELNAQGKGDTEIAQIMGRTLHSIGSRRRRLGLVGAGLAGQGRIRWTAPLDAELTKLWADKHMTTAQIGARLGIGRTAVKERARKLMLPRRGRIIPLPRTPVVTVDQRPTLADLWERRAQQHVQKCLAGGGFPALSEKWGRRDWICVLPLVWPDRRAA